MERTEIKQLNLAKVALTRRFSNFGNHSFLESWDKAKIPHREYSGERKMNRLIDFFSLIRHGNFLSFCYSQNTLSYILCPFQHVKLFQSTKSSQMQFVECHEGVQ